jgi:hypothetical protein
MEMGATMTMMMMMMMMATEELLSLCCRADEIEGRCARGFESRKIRVVRIVVVRGDRHMTVDVPSSIARTQFRSLE